MITLNTNNHNPPIKRLRPIDWIKKEALSSKMAKQVKKLATRPDNLSSNPGLTRRKETTNTYKLSFDHYTYYSTHIHIYK